MDGGEYVSNAGEFNGLKEVIFFFLNQTQSIGYLHWGVFITLFIICLPCFICQVTKEQWAMMESMIRSTKGS